MQPTTLFVGLGNMARAIIAGYTGTGGDKEDIAILDPFPAADADAFCNPDFIFTEPGAIGNLRFTTIVMAVKPQQYKAVERFLSGFADKKCIVISIMTGISDADIVKNLPSDAIVVRCMPNLAATVGQSVNAAYTSGEDGKDRFEELFSPTGKVFWLEKQGDLHLVTAVSGVGPGYIFSFVDAFEKAARDIGLPKEIAIDLVQETLSGSAALLKQHGSAAKLKAMVASKGGTTQAGLDVLEENDTLEKLVGTASKRSLERSIELGKPQG